MIWNEDAELRAWIDGIVIEGDRAGSFIRAVGEMAVRADGFNYAIVRPALLVLKMKYPRYEVIGHPRSGYRPR